MHKRFHLIARRVLYGNNLDQAHHFLKPSISTTESDEKRRSLKPNVFLINANKGRRRWWWNTWSEYSWERKEISSSLITSFFTLRRELPKQQQKSGVLVGKVGIFITGRWGWEGSERRKTIFFIISVCHRYLLKTVSFCGVLAVAWMHSK